MAEVKYATTSTLLTDAQGGRIAVKANEPWDAADPLVKLYPEHFADEPIWLRHTVPTADEQAAQRQALGLPGHPVEAATRAPGEQRKR